MSEVHITKVEYLVAAVPPEDERHPEVRLTVGWHIDRWTTGGRTGWTIERSNRQLAFSRRGEWDHIPRPSEQDEEWQDSHWFTEAEALKRARALAPGILAGWEAAMETRERRRNDRHEADPA
jgi:hypothetical protein